MSRRISSFSVPSAATLSAWVCPRVNSAEPCVRGATPTSIEMSRISFSPRPSGRFLCTAMRSRMIDFSSFSNASCAAARRALAAARAAPRWRPRARAGRAGRGSPPRPPWWRPGARACPRPEWRVELLAEGGTHLREQLLVNGGAWTASSPCRRCRELALQAQSFLISAWAMSSASRISASGISFAPASTIRIASSVPATTRSRSEAALPPLLSAWRVGAGESSVGLTTKLPSTLPMRTAPTGPGRGCWRSSAQRRRRSSRGCRRGGPGHRQRNRHQLGVIAPALGEQRAYRPVDHARGERRLFA